MNGHDPLPRRGFLMTGLIAGLSLAATRGEAAPIHTGDEGLVVSETTLPVQDGRLPVYLARPVGAGPFPIVVVIEEIFGVHDYIKDVCRRLAHLGYLAVAPELYARLADLSTMTDPQQIVRDVIAKAPDATVLSDLDATAAWAGTQNGDATRIGTIGFCRGGRDVWLYAEHSRYLRAAVAFYGPVASTDSPIQPRNPLELAATLKCPLLGLYGGQDHSISLSDVMAAQAAARAAGGTVGIHVYPDASHGFHADYRPSYRQADAEDGWDRSIRWLKQYGVD
jgi:carboxymethylenebutenolidase